MWFILPCLCRSCPPPPGRHLPKIQNRVCTFYFPSNLHSFQCGMMEPPEKISTFSAISLFMLQKLSRNIKKYDQMSRRSESLHTESDSSWQKKFIGKNGFNLFSYENFYEKLISKHLVNKDDLGVGGGAKPPDKKFTILHSDFRFWRKNHYFRIFFEMVDGARGIEGQLLRKQGNRWDWYVPNGWCKF